MPDLKMPQLDMGTMNAAASRSVEISAQATVQVQDAFSGMFGWALLPCTTKQGEETWFKEATIEDAPLLLPGDDGVPVGSFERRMGKTPAKNKKSKNNKAHTLPPAPPATVENEADPVQDFETGADGLQEEGGVEVEAARQVAGDAAVAFAEGRLDLDKDGEPALCPDDKEQDTASQGGDKAVGSEPEPVDGNKVGSGEEGDGGEPEATVAALRGEGGGGAEAAHQGQKGAVESRWPPATQKAAVWRAQQAARLIQ